MRFRRAEQSPDAPLPEPQVLGVNIDPESAALYDTFATGRRLDDIYEAWKDPKVINPTIRQRAVAALTVPRADWLPFPHGDQAFRSFLYMQEKIEGLPASSLRKRLAGRPELAGEAAQGILYWLDNTGERIQQEMPESWLEYQGAIRELLPMVDEPTADRLFGYFAINDPDEYEGMDSDSGYEPLMGLFYDRGVPQKYKMDGLNKWLDIAKQEEQGVRQPRAEHERATTKMAEFIQSWAHSEPTDNAILTTLVHLLEDQKTAKDDTGTYIRPYAVARVAGRITDPDLLFTFAWRHIALPKEDSKGAQFSIMDMHGLSLVTWLKDEAQKREIPGFEAKADQMVQNYETQCRQQTTLQAAETALRDQLRG